MKVLLPPILIPDVSNDGFMGKIILPFLIKGFMLLGVRRLSKIRQRDDEIAYPVSMRMLITRADGRKGKEEDELRKREREETMKGFDYPRVTWSFLVFRRKLYLLKSTATCFCTPRSLLSNLATFYLRYHLEYSHCSHYLMKKMRSYHIMLFRTSKTLFTVST